MNYDGGCGRDRYRGWRCGKAVVLPKNKIK